MAGNKDSTSTLTTFAAEEKTSRYAAPATRRRRRGLHEDHFDRKPIRALRRHSPRREATSRNIPTSRDAEAHVTKTAMTSSRREHFDGIPLGEARRKQT
ncbi:hypothetical protein ISCGN_028518 [Ixodes scapularis]